MAGIAISRDRGHPACNEREARTGEHGQNNRPLRIVNGAALWATPAVPVKAGLALLFTLMLPRCFVLCSPSV
jgi:hypothetical protein